MTTEELTAKLQQFDRQVAALARESLTLPDDSPRRVVIAADMAILHDRIKPVMEEAQRRGVSWADLSETGNFPEIPETDSDQS